MCTTRQLTKQLLGRQPMVVYTVIWIEIHGIQKEEPPDASLLRRYDGIEMKREMRKTTKKYWS